MTSAPKLRNRIVKDVMIREVVSIDSSTNLPEAAKQVQDSHVGMLPVMHGALRAS